MSKPYRLDGDAAPTPGAERIARDNAGPSNPLHDNKPTSQREMSGWAPGIGQNSAQIRKGDKPWPKVTAEDSVGKE